MSFAEAKKEDIYHAPETDIQELIRQYYLESNEHLDPFEMHIAHLQNMVGEWADRKGWNSKPRDMAEWAILGASEFIEMFEEHRCGVDPETLYFVKDDKGIMKPEGILVEQADAVIRVMHFFDKIQVSLGWIILLKMFYNETREHRHGGKRA